MPINEARSLVASPSRSPLPYGLLSVARSTPDADSHWMNGIRFQGFPCATAGVTIDPCPSPPPDLTPTVVGLPDFGGEAFGVWAWSDCLVDEDPSAYATRLLEWGEERSVERTFWTGSAAATGGGTFEVNPHLAEDTAIQQTVGGRVETIQTAATVVTTGSPVDLVEAMGRIEAELAWCYGGQGVIHVPRALGPALAHSNLVRAQGNQLLTNPNGNLVALGSGYSGSGPDGTIPTNATWIYATGAVMMRRSDVKVTEFNESFDRLKNEPYVTAQRWYQLVWECCHLAAQVNQGGIPAGAAGTAGPAS